MLARRQLPVRAQEQRVGPRAAPQVQHDGTIRPRASPGAARKKNWPRKKRMGRSRRPRTQLPGAFKRVMPSERFCGGRAGALGF